MRGVSNLLSNAPVKCNLTVCAHAADQSASTFTSWLFGSRCMHTPNCPSPIGFTGASRLFRHATPSASAPHPATPPGGLGRNRRISPALIIWLAGLSGLYHAHERTVNHELPQVFKGHAVRRRILPVLRHKAGAIACKTQTRKWFRHSHQARQDVDGKDRREI